MSAQPEPSGRTKQVLILAAVVLAAVLMGVLMVRGGGEQNAPAASATPTSEVEANPQGSGVAGSSTEEPEVEEEPEAVFGQTAAPNPTEDFEGTDADEELEPPKAPAFEPSSDREPEDGDEERAREVLERILPAWASNDTSQGNSLETWTPGWQGEEGVGVAFYRQSTLQYRDLWQGLTLLGASAVDGRVTSAEQLWNVGSHSLWRVDVERDLESNHGQTISPGTETITWDFLVNQDGEVFELEAFTDPSPENEDPATFYVSEDL